MSTPQQSMPSSPLTAQPTFLVDANGNPLSSSNPLVPNQRVNAQSGDFVAGSIVDLATLAAAISGGRMLITTPAQNADIVLLASATYTSNQSPANQTNLYGKGLWVFITTGAFGASAATIVVNINAVDPSSGTNSLLLASAALTASSSTVLQIYPAISTTANQKLNGALTKTWNITVTAANWGTGGSVIGVGASVIL